MRLEHGALGYVKDDADPRDFLLCSMRDKVELPVAEDLLTLPGLPSSWNQLKIGSCTSFSSLFAPIYLQIKSGYKWPFNPAFLFQYYNTRLLAGNEKIDSGGQIRDAIKAMAKYGICPDYFWPYIAGKFAQEPPTKAYEDALIHQISEYARVPLTSDDLRYAIAIEKVPVILGIQCFENLDSDEVANSGILKMPKKRDRFIGGHAVAAVKFNWKHKKLGRAFGFRNSWGPRWGDKGLFWVPEEYVLQYASDPWIVRNSEELKWPKAA